MREEEYTVYGALLMRRLAEIESKIKDLEEEKHALRRELMKARRSAVLQDVSRRNSANRVLVEAKVVDTLRRSKRAVTSRALYAAAKDVDYDLLENTFRTHLHRMKQKGIIKSVGRGLWALESAEV